MDKGISVEDLLKELKEVEEGIAKMNWARRQIYNLECLIYQLKEDWTPVMIYRHLKWFWQRGRRGYADCDIWSFDTYLAGVIGGGVRQLSESTISYPCILDEKKWNKILDEMATGFDAYRNMEDAPWEEVEPKLKRSLNLFRKWFAGLWD